MKFSTLNNDDAVFNAKQVNMHSKCQQVEERRGTFTHNLGKFVPFQSILINGNNNNANNDDVNNNNNDNDNDTLYPILHNL